MRILFVGDVVGRVGRDAVRRLLPQLRERHRPDVIIANGENAAGGAGLTPTTAEELFRAGVDVITLGNHTWDHRDLVDYLDEHPRLIRPLNLPAAPPGRGWLSLQVGEQRLIVVNLMGRVFFPTFQDDPFQAIDALLAELGERPGAVLIDFHAEATSEKQALAWHLDGRVSAVIGTHTHVQTADARVLPEGTGFITDVGMTGPIDSVIGVLSDVVIERFRTQRPVRFEAARGRAVLSAVVIEIDPADAGTTGIESIYELLSNGVN